MKILRSNSSIRALVKQVSPEDDVVSEGDPDVGEPVVGLVVPEEEVDGRDVLYALLTFLQVRLHMLNKIK